LRSNRVAGRQHIVARPRHSQARRWNDFFDSIGHSRRLERTGHWSALLPIAAVLGAAAIRRGALPEGVIEGLSTAIAIDRCSGGRESNRAFQHKEEGRWFVFGFGCSYRPWY